MQEGIHKLIYCIKSRSKKKEKSRPSIFTINHLSRRLLLRNYHTPFPRHYIIIQSYAYAYLYLHQKLRTEISSSFSVISE
ncbi:hypothetical protein L1887_22959 [Cichorium endivia]|nr:hypothetical protein L1887_22959 [Cichorium endivia]